MRLDAPRIEPVDLDQLDADHLFRNGRQYLGNGTGPAV